MGLKTVIAELPGTTQTVATNASRNITGKLVDAIARPVSVDRPFNWKGETHLWAVFNRVWPGNSMQPHPQSTPILLGNEVVLSVLQASYKWDPVHVREQT